MNKNDNDSKLIGRRRTLALLGAGLGAGSLFVLGACNKDKGGGAAGSNSGGTAATMDCYSPVDDASKTTRRTLQYKSEAADPAKHCSACAQFNAGQYGECGGCKLFSGPVKPGGGCLSFAPKAGEAGAVPT